MKVAKSLKYVDFEWDDESKSFTITEEDGNRVILNKVYAFAFMRFVVRMAQRNWLRNKPIKKEKNKPAKLAEYPFDDPNQTEFTYEEVSPPKDYDKEDFNKKTKKQWDGSLF